VTGRHSDTSADGGDDVGSLAEEAAKLLGALSGWAQEHGGSGRGPIADGLAGHLVDQMSHAAHEGGEHFATGAPECTVCPVCRAVHAVRQLNPEVKAHLSVAASSLVQAAAGLMATVVPGAEDGPGPTDDQRGTRRRTEPVKEVVLDEDWPEESS
jgi:hypothetical protein